jgi:hypothetical protein
LPGSRRAPLGSAFTPSALLALAGVLARARRRQR